MASADNKASGAGDSDARANPWGWIDSIAKFSGEDMTYSSSKWAQDIDDNAEIFGWNAQQKLIIARRSLTGTAELWLRTEKTYKTYEELKAALIKEFPETVNSKNMHEVMKERKKLGNETYLQYMLVMKELGKRAKYPDYVAIQYIVDGITDHETNKLMLYGVTSYPVLKEKLALYESFKEKTRRHEPRLHFKSSERPDIATPIPPVRAEAERQQVRPPPRCYNCGEWGHLASACQKGIKCFRCNEYGHIGTTCNKAFKDKRTMAVRCGTCGFLPQDGETSAIEWNEAVADPVGTNGSEKCQNDADFYSLSVNTVNKDNGTVSVNKSVKSAEICGQSVKCLVDTGSELNLITFQMFRKLNVLDFEHVKVTIAGLGSSKVYSLGKFSMDVILDGYKYNVCFYVVPTYVLPYCVILGQPFLSNTILTINKGTIEVRPQFHDSSYQVGILPNQNDDSVFSKDPVVQSKVQAYQPLKAKEDDIPVTQRLRRLALSEEKVVSKQVDEQLQKGIFRPSYSEYVSPLVLVKKKDSKTRVCVDYLKINQKMKKLMMKLKQKFFGPYRVKKTAGKSRCEVEKVDRSNVGPMKTTMGVDYMKRWPWFDHLT